jgi:hypothetical protein
MITVNQKTMKRSLVFCIAFILAAIGAYPQESKTYDHTVALNFIQIKEQANYGLVFKGPGLGYAFSASWENENRILDYEGRFSFNVPVTREIIAASVNFVPVRFDYLFKTGNEGKWNAGPYAIIDYNYELYPDLQSGYSYWFTNISLGAAVERSFTLKGSQIAAAIHTTLLGFTSRQPVYDDPYFFDLGFGDIVRFINQNLQFGSWNSYNQSELELRWTPGTGSRLAYAYSFQYYGYFDEPELTMINQSVKLIILPKKNK